MSLPKFLSLLQQQALYFSSLEYLARSDPFEGTLPPARFAHRAWKSIEELPPEVRSKLPDYLKRGETDLDLAFTRLLDFHELRIRQAYAYRRSFFLNCWHQNEHESAAMWSLYSRANEGIAIVSSEDKFRLALAATPIDVYGGCVQYGDYGSAEFTIDDGNAFRPVLYKRQSFAHEREYRLVNWDTSVTHKDIDAVNGVFTWEGHIVPDVSGSGRITVGRSESEIEAIKPTPGIVVPCQLRELIARVVVSPLAEDWFFDVVAAASSAHGITVPVERSKLADEPLR
ncbi:hypothetical protein CDA09_10385 [Azoarcus sp. DN11]|nr:hypothetical protein CDA09_10385 [Azoarcus sp. DN11]